MDGWSNSTSASEATLAAHKRQIGGFKRTPICKFVAWAGKRKHVWVTQNVLLLTRWQVPTPATTSPSDPIRYVGRRERVVDVSRMQCTVKCKWCNSQSWVKHKPLKTTCLPPSNSQLATQEKLHENLKQRQAIPRRADEAVPCMHCLTFS
jgi:hypothetical protein